MSIPGAGGSRSAAAAGEPGIKSDSTEYTSSPPPNDEVINTTELAARESDQPNARVDMPVMGDRQRAANSLCGLCRGEYSGPAESERAVSCEHAGRCWRRCRVGPTRGGIFAGANLAVTAAPPPPPPRRAPNAPHASFFVVLLSRSLAWPRSRSARRGRASA